MEWFSESFSALFLTKPTSPPSPPAFVLFFSFFFSTFLRCAWSRSFHNPMFFFKGDFKPRSPSSFTFFLPLDSCNES